MNLGDGYLDVADDDGFANPAGDHEHRVDSLSCTWNANSPPLRSSALPAYSYERREITLISRRRRLRGSRAFFSRNARRGGRDADTDASHDEGPSSTKALRAMLDSGSRSALIAARRSSRPRCRADSSKRSPRLRAAAASAPNSNRPA